MRDSGFDNSGSCFDKHGTPSGEGARFNELPPGDDISKQSVRMINKMRMNKITPITYPGDSGFSE